MGGLCHFASRHGMVHLRKTFTSMSGFKASLKARRMSGGFHAEEAPLLPPVEVKVLDSYLTVFSTIGPPVSSSFPSGGETLVQ